jgi:hypothetical protein
VLLPPPPPLLPLLPACKLRAWLLLDKSHRRRMPRLD